MLTLKNLIMMFIIIKMLIIKKQIWFSSQEFKRVVELSIEISVNIEKVR
jgi:hypothetical protein